MKTLIVGDLHINERSISEIDEIFEKDILSIESDRIIQLGDFFDKNTPTPLELKFSSELVLKLKKHYKEVIILSGTGSHDLLRGTSVIEHLESLGVKVIKGDYNEDNLLFGHWMTNESKFEYGTAKHTVTELKKYKNVFLGHQHNPQIIDDHIYHIGSIRHVNFNEVDDIKHIVLLEDDRLFFIQLKHCIPMKDVTDVTQLEQIDTRTKVRVIFNSFEDYKKNASYVNKVGKKFFLFKLKMNFEQSKILVNASKKLDPTEINKNNIIQSYIDKIEDKEVQRLLKEQFDENI